MTESSFIFYWRM